MLVSSRQHSPGVSAGQLKAAKYCESLEKTYDEGTSAVRLLLGRIAGIECKDVAYC